MIGIILALIVSFLKSLWEVMGKTYTDTSRVGNIDEYSLAWGTRFLSLIVMSPLLFFGIPEISTKMWGILLFSAIIWAISTVSALKALKYGDLSVVSPLNSLTLPFLLVTGYVIAGESLNISGYIGVAIIFIWIYFLQIQDAKKWLLAPIRSLSENQWARYMFLTAFLWSISSPLDKIWVLELWALNWMFLSNASISIVLSLFLLFTKKSLPFREILGKKHIKKLLTISLVWGLSIYLQMLATKYTLVIYVIALKRASGMFSVFLWYLFFQEKNIKQKMFSAFLMMLWIGIISLLWNI